MGGRPVPGNRPGGGAVGRTLGVDHGRRRVGVALSDGLGISAHPLEVIDMGPGVEERLADLVRENGVARVVVGLPVSLDGVERASAREARGFAERVRSRLEVEVVMYDERFTSKIAERILVGEGVSRSERRARVDGAAAAVMLQGYLDRRVNEAGGLMP